MPKPSLPRATWDHLPGEMSDGTGFVLIVSGALGILATAFLLRRRLPAPVVFVLAAGCSVALTAGALVVQDDTTTADWIVALTAMGLLGPAHVRVLLGPFGPSAGPGTAATEPV
jgi:hypothetical protein